MTTDQTPNRAELARAAYLAGMGFLLVLLLAALSLVLEGCGGLPAPGSTSVIPDSCPFEDLSAWDGGQPGWASDGDVWLTYTTGCQGKAVQANLLIGRPQDAVTLRRSLALKPHGMVRVSAALLAAQGMGSLTLEVRDDVAQLSAAAQPTPESDFAQIVTWLPSGVGSVVLRAAPAADGAPFGVVFSDVTVEAF